MIVVDSMCGIYAMCLRVYVLLISLESRRIFNIARTYIRNIYIKHCVYVIFNDIKTCELVAIFNRKLLCTYSTHKITAHDDAAQPVILKCI